MKKLTKLVLSLIIAISTFCIPIYAEDEAVTNEMEYILPEQRYEEFIDQLKIGVENEIGSSDFKILGYRKQNYLEEVPAYQTQEYIGETTQIRSVGYASNQYPQGVTFSNGGTIYYSDSTGSDVSLSFSISGYGVSVGVGLGKKASGVTGYALNCPANKACKIYVKKKIRVVLYKVTVSYEGQVHSVSNVPVKTELALYLSNGLE